MRTQKYCLDFLSIIALTVLLHSCESKVSSTKVEAIEESESQQSISVNNADIQLTTPLCDKPDCKFCELPSGEKFLSGARVTLFKKNNSGCGLTCQVIGAEAICNDGKIEGADPKIYSFLTCQTPKDCKPCTLPCGVRIEGGQTGSCFSNHTVAKCGETCFPFRKVFSCNNGVVTSEEGAPVPNAAEFKYGQCLESTICKKCTLPNGREIADGQSAAFFKRRSLNCGQSCTSKENHVLLTCSNGVFADRQLFPEFVYDSCSTDCSGDKGAGRIEGEGGGAPNSICPIPWGGGSATHKTKVLAFSRPIAKCGESCTQHKKIIECNGYRGLWSGGATYIYPSCLEQKCP